MQVNKHIDVLIVGAGISGIGAAYRLKQRCSDRSWLILERRTRIGGTWDLFRYPGVRSDSDMFTLGFPFRPWASDQAIAGGDAIRRYIEDTAREFGILEGIRFNTHATAAHWSSADARWTVETDQGAYTCDMLYFASGYYDYDEGHRPQWPGEGDYRGRIVHPQSWPDDLDLAGKKVAVIGSGATAVTLVPALAERAAHVTMVQRTPSYIVSRPSRDNGAGWLQRVLPARFAAPMIRWKNVLLTIYFFAAARRRPERVSQWIQEQIRKFLPKDYPVERDFTPPYKPWDQRLCLVPDGDLFAAIAKGKAAVATGAIERFTADGLRLSSGATVPADIVVTATGLNLKLLGGIQLTIDGAPVDPVGEVIHRGMMLSNIPNLAFSFGYVNASWTLRSDLTARSFCRLLNHMRKKGSAVVIPRLPAELGRRPVLDFSSSYVARARAILPQQGDRQPWHVPQNYVSDRLAMRFRPISEDLEFIGNEAGAHA